MNSYTVIYHGPSKEEDPKAARRIADELASRSAFSAEEALARLASTPFIIGSGLSGEAAHRHKIFLETIGARAEVLASKHPRWAWPSQDEAVAVAPTRGWLLRGAARGIISILASGLLLSTMIVVAGIALVVFSPLLAGPGFPPELLGAVGWSAVALGVLVLIAAMVFRLPALMRLVRPPDLSTPLQAMKSYLHAVNQRHWIKARSCLAGRPGCDDLANKSDSESAAYLRDLSKRVVLPREISTTDVALLQEGENYVVLRFHLEIISRNSAADGSYQRRVVTEANRFCRIKGKWYLLDGYFLGQRDAARLPQSGCPECGEEVMAGKHSCNACGAVFPPATVVEEEWLTPRRRPELAAVLSAVIPGLGQAYNGQSAKGLLIAATSWTLLPWVAGVVDALRMAERINRNDSYHDVPRRPLPPMLAHLALFGVALVLVLANAERLPLVNRLIGVRSEAVAEKTNPIFHAPGDRFTLLLPPHWTVREQPEEGRSFAFKAVSEDGQSSVMISGRPLPQGWQPCPQARAARDRLEADGSEVAHTECGSVEGRLRYRVDSYSPDRRWRRSLIAVAVEEELLVISFACPAERQDELVPAFDRMISSLEFQTAREIN